MLKKFKSFKFLILFASLMFTAFLAGQTHIHALNLEDRSITVVKNTPSANTGHKIEFSYPTTDDVGSVRFLYCTSALPQDPCTAPAGLNVSGATLDNQTGETGFSIDSSTLNEIIISRSASSASLLSATYTFGNVINPSSEGSFFVRISTYQSEDGSGSPDNRGTVVSSINEGISISTEVPQILEFCVGRSISGQCSSAQGNFIRLGELSANSTATATSQMMAGTNADFGYVIRANGPTMTSGNNIIRALNNKAPSIVGQAQFGINLRNNSLPSVGSNPSGAGIATPTSGYSTPNQFRYRDGDVVASSPDETNKKKFTISYIVNIAQDQPPGIYNTTLTYVCMATF